MARGKRQEARGKRQEGILVCSAALLFILPMSAEASPLLDQLTFGKYSSILDTYQINQLATSWQYANQDFQFSLAAGTGQDLVFGVFEHQDCYNGQLDQVDDSHQVFDYMDVIHYQPGSLGTDFQNHVTGVASQYAYFKSGDPVYDIVPQTRLLVANPCRNQVGDSLDWLLKGKTRLVSRSTAKQRTADCGLEDLFDAQSFDWWGRKNDIVMTVAAGQTRKLPCDTSNPNDSTLCLQGNAICVGAAFDTRRRNTGTSTDLRDDYFADGSGHDEDGLAISQYRYLYTNGSFITYSGTGRLDRERPHVVAEVVGSTPWTDETLLALHQSGTSLAAPRALASIGESLEFMGGDHWTQCRISEWTRAMTVFSAWVHSVWPYRSDLGNTTVGPKRTAYHDLPISEVAGGKLEWEHCLEPNDCEIGLTCMGGQCRYPYEIYGGNGSLQVGDICTHTSQCQPGSACLYAVGHTTPNEGKCQNILEQADRTGWGYVSDFSHYADDYICRGPDGSGTGDPCLPTLDGSCQGPSHFDNDRPGPGVPPPTPNGVNAASNGKALWAGHLEKNQIFRGVLAWSSCPYHQGGKPPTGDCQTDEQCSPQHYCDELGNCRPRQEEPLGVDFNVGVWRPDGKFVWLSYSLHDVTEAFEFVAPEDGHYEFWRYADRDEWGCLDQNWQRINEYDPFVGGRIF